MDDSHLNSKYFINEHVYNCPFCNRRNVSYHIKERNDFDWSDKKNVTFILLSVILAYKNQCI